MMMMMIK